MFSTARCVAGASLTLSYVPVDADGEPSETDPGTVTIGVTSSDGTEVVAAGTATSGTGEDQRTFTLAATATATCDELTATWTVSGTTVHQTVVDVVGGVYATTAEIRALEPTLTDEVKYPAARLIRARNEIEALVDRSCRDVFAFVPRFDVATVDHHGGCILIVPHYFVRAVRWATWIGTNGASQTIDLSAGVSIDGDAGLITLNTGTWRPGRIRVGYEHGMPAPPADVKKQVCAAIRRYANQPNTAIDPRAMSQTLDPGPGQWVTGVGNRRISLPGPVPEIDEVLRSYRSRFPAAAVA